MISNTLNSGVLWEMGWIESWNRKQFDNCAVLVHLNGFCQFDLKLNLPPGAEWKKGTLIQEGKAKIEESKILCEELLWHHFNMVPYK